MQHGRVRLERLLYVENRGKRLIVDVQPLGRVLGSGPAGGDHDRDRLTDVADGVGGKRVHRRVFLFGDEADRDRERRLEIGHEVLAGPDGEHPTCLRGARGVDPGDTRMSLGAANDVEMGDGRLGQVLDKTSRAGDQLGVFATLDRGANQLGDRHSAHLLRNPRLPVAWCRRLPSPWRPPGPP